VIEIAEFQQPTDVKEQAIRERALRSKVPRSRQFIARVDCVEAGYLSFDDRSDIEVGVLYEILVLPRFRRQGVGTALIAVGENLALSLGCKRMRLSPKAFDGSVDQGWLESWYLRRGYIPSRDGSREYEKLLVSE
jgi:GNAT superfamily N-acetyltransferase